MYNLMEQKSSYEFLWKFLLSTTQGYVDSSSSLMV